MSEQYYMNIETGSVDTYDGWYYENEEGITLNAVDYGDVIAVYPKPVTTNDGYVRAYFVEEGGALRLTEMTVQDDGVLLDSDLQPIPIQGAVHELLGWPDIYAVQVNSQLMIAVDWVEV